LASRLSYAAMALYSFISPRRLHLSHRERPDREAIRVRAVQSHESAQLHTPGTFGADLSQWER